MNKSTANLIGYYTSFISIGIVSASLGPTLPDLMAQTKVDLSQISTLFAARPIGYLIGSVLAGRLYDRRAGHPLMALAVTGLALGMVAIPLTSWLGVLIAIMVLIGMVEAGVDIGGNTLIVWTYGDRVGPFMNGLHFMFGVGAFIAPLVVAQALHLTGGITWAYWVLAALIVPSILWLSFVPSPAIRTAAHTGQTGPVNYGLVALISAFFFLYTGAEISYGAWIFTYAKSLGLADSTLAAYLNSAFWGALTLGRLLSIPAASRFRARVIIVVSLIGAIIGVVIPLVIANSVVAIWVGAILTGLSLAAIFPTTLSFGERRLGLTGQITSFFFMGASLGSIFVPWLIGQLFDKVGAQVTMVTILTDLLVAGVVFGILIKQAMQPAKAGEQSSSSA